jgi:hypothetical protein
VKLTNVIGHADRTGQLRDCCAGLLTAEGRKSGGDGSLRLLGPTLLGKICQQKQGRIHHPPARRTSPGVSMTK